MCMFAFFSEWMFLTIPMVMITNLFTLPCRFTIIIPVYSAMPTDSFGYRVWFENQGCLFNFYYIMSSSVCLIFLPIAMKLQN